MIQIHANINKHDIEKMPTAQFEGRIFTISTVDEAKKAVNYLMGFHMLGIDTETRPNFQKGPGYQVGLLQVSTHDTCFLFRLNRIGIPDCLVKLLGSNKPIKVGLSLKDDIRVLNNKRKFKFGRYVEIQEKVRDIGILDMSLQKIYANLFGKKISKSKRLTNWEAPTLTEGQKRYAATDAWACLKMLDLIDELRISREFEYISPMDDEQMFGIWLKDLLTQLNAPTKAKKPTRKKLQGDKPKANKTKSRKTKTNKANTNKANDSKPSKAESNKGKKKTTAKTAKDGKTTKSVKTTKATKITRSNKPGKATTRKPKSATKNNTKSTTETK